MPEIVSCPECQRQLRVPDDLLGKRVKCPSCSTTFTATPVSQSAPAPEEEEEEESPRPRSRAAEPSEEEEEPETGIEEEERPRRRRRRDEDEEEDEDFDEGARPGRRRRRRRSLGGSLEDARQIVAGPSVAMLISGIIGVLLSICSTINHLTGFAINGAGAQQVGGAEMAGFMAGGVVGITADILYLVAAVITIIASQKMKNLESYGLAMTGAILTVVPCTTCPCWGIPI
ncbi:MAG: hypothetical protein JO112_04930, partial [Planctomycetes bacterium]|nr:hypothetical protein [Planctomycetota bacterium]